MTSSDSTRAFVIDKAATIAAIKRFEAATGRVLQAVEGFSDLPEGQALRTLKEAHAEAEAELEAADAALYGEIRRLHHHSLSPAVMYGDILYVPIAMRAKVDTGTRGSKMKIVRLFTNYDILKLD